MLVFALKNWKTLLKAALAFIVATIVGCLYVALERTRVDLAHEQTAYATLNGNYQTALNENKTLSASNANLGLVVSTQSKSIEWLGAQGQKQKVAADAALATALAKQATDRQTIARLSARITDPKTNQGTCQDEIQALRNNL